MAAERPDRLIDYDTTISYDLQFGGGHPLPFLRDEIEAEMAGWGDEAIQELNKQDVDFLDYILMNDEEDIWPSLLERHPDQPLGKWWWHLGAIRRREYPADFLPEHLRAMYEEKTA